MNVSIYTFGEFTSGYTQYPSDYTTDIFKEFYKKSKAQTQLCIHRDGDIMYYAYIRRLEGGRYFGVCAVINGLMLVNIPSVFTLFEQMFGGLVSRGELLMFDVQGNITTNVTQLYMEREAVEQLQEVLRLQRDKQHTSFFPPAAFSMAKDSVKDFILADNTQDIIDASSRYGYTYIYKDKGYNTAQLNSYKGVIARINKEKTELQNKCDTLSQQLTAERIKQQNMKWVVILGVIAVIFGAVLWNKVLFPSEVTHYETGEFVYYGPLKDNKPNGIGVAIYPENDVDGRRYYVGNFIDGKRDDTAALLLYQNGNYYYGTLKNDSRVEGIDFNRSENSHYEGTFSNDQPYNGVLYDHKKAYRYEYGTLKYAE